MRFFLLLVFILFSLFFILNGYIHKDSKQAPQATTCTRGEPYQQDPKLTELLSFISQTISSESATERTNNITEVATYLPCVYFQAKPEQGESISFDTANSSPNKLLFTISSSFLNEKKSVASSLIVKEVATAQESFLKRYTTCAEKLSNSYLAMLDFISLLPQLSIEELANQQDTPSQSQKEVYNLLVNGKRAPGRTKDEKVQNYIYSTSEYQQTCKE